MSIFSPLAAGAIYDHFSPASPYWLTAALFAVAALLLRRVERK
jgi:hypothetical protein